MRFVRVRTIMVFVTEPAAAARYWSRLLDVPIGDGPLVDLGHIELFFHAADPERNPQGGTVAYFEVADLDAARDELTAAGCTVHRGPLAFDGERICQVRDPFGTVWGLHQPRATPRSGR